MKRRTVWQTSDGQFHASSLDAKRHAEKRVADALSRLCVACAVMTDAIHFKCRDFFMANLDQFVELHNLQQDVFMQLDDGDED